MGKQVGGRVELDGRGRAEADINIVDATRDHALKTVDGPRLSLRGARHGYSASKGARHAFDAARHGHVAQGDKSRDGKQDDPLQFLHIRRPSDERAVRSLNRLQLQYGARRRCSRRAKSSKGILSKP